ncbi:transmembrane protein 126A [Lampris incognitus]|uniref:transmembrane protein 126A n=1 Tax=Lampris incognitus TaxID=2546036 RepID=UPI0024B56AB1|nr:transmembrane protein 126A [Lampris incognitus]
MSEMTSKDDSVDKTLLRVSFYEMMLGNFDRLPETDKKVFTHGPFYLGANSALAGLIANSFYRRVLNVAQARIASSLPMAVLPFVTTVILYDAAIKNPLLYGDINCPTCVLLRGAVVGVFGGGLYPILLALPVNASLAARYNTTPMPEKGNIFRFFMDISKPVLRKMRVVLVFQAIFGTYLSSRHFDTYVSLAKMTLGDEELKD